MGKRRRALLLSVTCLALLQTGATIAALQNNDLPLNVKAQTVHIDEKTGTAVYRGNVVLTQGSMQLEADRLDVRTDKNRRLNNVIATGYPAKLRGFIENSNEEIKAEAQRVEYRAKGREIEMTGNAWARQGKDEF